MEQKTLTDLRNHFYDTMPRSGEMKAWDMITWASQMFKEFDEYIDASQPPVNGEEGQKFYDYLSKYGGKIVCTSVLTPFFIDQARASGRLFVQTDGIGYVWEPDINDFPATEEEVEEFEKWYPLPVPDAELIDPEKILARIKKPQPSPATLEDAAREYATNHSNAPDQETPDWIIADFKAGAKWAMSQSSPAKAEQEGLLQASGTGKKASPQYKKSIDQLQARERKFFDILKYILKDEELALGYVGAFEEVVKEAEPAVDPATVLNWLQGQGYFDYTHEHKSGEELLKEFLQHTKQQ